MAGSCPWPTQLQRCPKILHSPAMVSSAHVSSWPSAASQRTRGECPLSGGFLPGMSVHFEVDDQVGYRGKHQTSRRRSGSRERWEERTAESRKNQSPRIGGLRGKASAATGRGKGWAQQCGCVGMPGPRRLPSVAEVPPVSHPGSLLLAQTTGPTQRDDDQDNDNDPGSCTALRRG
jgi:hypothetical protein